MKVRLGFVSNSSSSSFVCEITGNTESGYDMSLKDAGMSECVNGHVICEELKLSPTFILEEAVTNFVDHYNSFSWRKNELYDADVATKCAEKKVDDWESFFELVQNNWDEEYGGNYGSGYPKEFCPICMLEELPNDILVRYLLKQDGKTKKELVSKIRTEIGSYDKLVEYLNEE